MATKNLFDSSVSQSATPTYIKPGAQDNSSAIMIQGLGSLVEPAVKAYENYTVGKYIKDNINPDITQLENYMQEGERVTALGATVAESEQLISDNFNKPDPGGDNKNPYADQLMKRYDEQTKTLAAAQAQGKLSPEEFDARYKKNLREAINKTPWLEQELYAKGQAHLNALGVIDEISAFNKSASKKKTAEEADHKFLMEYAKTLGVFGTTASLDSSDAELKAAIHVEEAARQRVEMFKRSADLGQQNDRAVFVDRIRSGKAAETADTQQKIVTEQFLVQASQGGAGGYSSAIAAMKFNADNWLSQLRGSMGHFPEGKDFIAGEEKRYASLTQTLEDLGSGTKATEYVEKRNRAVVAQRSLQMHTDVDVPRMDMALKVASTLQQAGLQDPAVLNVLLHRVTAMTGPAINATDPAVVKGLSSGSTAQAFADFSNHTLQYQNESDKGVLSIYTRNMASAIIDPQTDRTNSMRTGNAVLKTIATNPKFSLMSRDPSFAVDTAKIVDHTMKNTMQDMFDVVTTEMANNPKLSISYDVLPNGTFKIDTNDPKKGEQFTKAFSNQINNALEAYSISQGITKAQAAPDFFASYFSDLVKAKAPKQDFIPGDEPLNLNQPISYQIDPKVQETKAKPQRPKTPKEPSVSQTSKNQKGVQLKNEVSRAQGLAEEEAAQIQDQIERRKQGK